jgi:hypothetical protein
VQMGRDIVRELTGIHPPGQDRFDVNKFKD